MEDAEVMIERTPVVKGIGKGWVQFGGLSEILQSPLQVAESDMGSPRLL